MLGLIFILFPNKQKKLEGIEYEILHGNGIYLIDLSKYKLIKNVRNQKISSVMITLMIALLVIGFVIDSTIPLLFVVLIGLYTAKLLNK